MGTPGSPSTHGSNGLRSLATASHCGFRILANFSTHGSICLGRIERHTIKQIKRKGKMKGVRKKRNRAVEQSEISTFC